MTADPASLAERLRRGIEEDILEGRLAPGDVLDERTLAARYQVSRTPVREALLQLSSLGLVTLHPRQKAEVAEMGIGRLVQMFEVMSLLEGGAAQLAARRMTAEQRRDVEAIQEEADEIVARGDYAAFNVLNWKLHLAIFAGSQNDFLHEQARMLRLRLHGYRCYLIRLTGRMPAAHAEHRAIVDAIRKGDDEAAFQAMRRHLAVDSDRLSDFLAALPRSLRERTEAS